MNYWSRQMCPSFPSHYYYWYYGYLRCCLTDPKNYYFFYYQHSIVSVAKTTTTFATAAAGKMCTNTVTTNHSFCCCFRRLPNYYYCSIATGGMAGDECVWMVAVAAALTAVRMASIQTHRHQFVHLQEIHFGYKFFFFYTKTKKCGEKFKFQISNQPSQSILLAILLTLMLLFSCCDCGSGRIGDDEICAFF